VLLRSLYHGDARDEHGVVFSGSVDAFVEAQPQLMAPFEVTAHHIANMSYRIDGNRADGELYFTAYHRTLGDTPAHIVVHGRYLDNYECRGGEWKIAHRRLVWDSFITLAVAPNDDSQLRALGIVGSDENDLSYQALPLMGRGR
jgi:hypothetical protein